MVFRSRWGGFKTLNDEDGAEEHIAADIARHDVAQHGERESKERHHVSAGHLELHSLLLRIEPLFRHWRGYQLGGRYDRPG